MAAKAAMIVVDLDAENVISCDVITDNGEGMDPRFRAERLWKSVKDDWPNCTMVIASNEEADELAGQRRMWSFGIKDEAPDMAERIEAHNAEVEARRAAA